MHGPISTKALALATKAHEGQTRKYTGAPYIQHPIEVAAKIASRPYATDELEAAALLHDTVEDTDLTLAEIERECGPVVAAYVDALTDKYTPETHPTMNRKARKLAEAIRLGSLPREVRAIKLADIENNLRATDPADPFSEVFLKEKDDLLPRLRDADPDLYAEAEAAAEKLRVASTAARAAREAEKKAKKEKAQ